MKDLIWLIPGLPLFGFVVLVVGGRRLGEPRAGWFATAMVGGSFAVVVAAFVGMLQQSAEMRGYSQRLFPWVEVGGFVADIGFRLDPLSLTMCGFITGVGALIHLYAIGYMHGDPKFSKFFLYLNLFVFSMLMLVLGDNMLLTFLGWEGVGACSYFLISFWHSDMANAVAGKKAFVTNRVGDFGFMLASFVIYREVGSIRYSDILAHDWAHAHSSATIVVLLLMLAAAGKSAQLPLFVWLPDAMAGPTPVSALIHAATMVTSGVYLLVRLNPLVHHSGWAQDLVAWVGVITALVAATIAVAQNDIKKVLAYSTVSQLGYLFLAVGTGSYVAAMFHMVTHAFFKALMFMGSGSVIIGMEHDQDMRHYGNLRKYMPITAVTYLIGWLAIAGVPPFSGFWSKDEILAGAYAHNKVLWVCGLIVALLTAFYMTRQIVMTFFGQERWRSLEDSAEEHDGHAHHLTPEHTPHESPWVITLPLVLLAGLAAVGGALNLPFTHSTEMLANWLEPVVGTHELGETPLLVLAVVAVVVALLGIAGAIAVYSRGVGRRSSIEQPAFANGWWIDHAYSTVVSTLGASAFNLIAWIDRNLVDGLVNGIGGGFAHVSAVWHSASTGRIRTYALAMTGGAALMLVYVILRMSV